MQRSSTIRIILRSLGSGALMATLCTPVHANAPAAAPLRGSEAWMPDVRERVLDLRNRAKRAADEARTRRDQDARQGQWWRAVAARPAQQVSR